MSDASITNGTLVIGTGVLSLGNTCENGTKYITAENGSIETFSGMTMLKVLNYNATLCEDMNAVLSYRPNGVETIVYNEVFKDAGKNATGITLTIASNVTRIPAYLFNPNNSTSYAPNAY